MFFRVCRCAFSCVPTKAVTQRSLFGRVPTHAFLTNDEKEVGTEKKNNLVLASFVAYIGREIGWGTESGTVGVNRARGKPEGGKDVDGERVATEKGVLGSGANAALRCSRDWVRVWG